MELKAIKDNITRVKLSNKRNGALIKQLKFIGAAPVKESRYYTYFDFPGDITKTIDMLGVNVI